MKQLLRPTRVLHGVGIHSGLPATLQILPPQASPPGIHFTRDGVTATTPARFDRVACTHLLKTELEGGFCTVEHVLAALFGLRVPNALVVVGGGEVPIMDGSSIDFCHAVMEAGLGPLTEEKAPPFRVIDRVVEATGGGGAYCRLLPPTSTRSSLHVSLAVEFVPGLVERFEYEHVYDDCEDSNDVFLLQLAPAKTFAMRQHVAPMLQMGLGLGGNAHNCIVYEEDDTATYDGNHRVRHKLLDLLGDLALCGHCRLVGRVQAHRTGHQLNHQALTKLMQSS